MPLGITYPQQQKLLEMAKVCSHVKDESGMVRFNTSDRLAILVEGEEDWVEEFWDWLEYTIVVIPSFLGSGDPHKAWVLRSRMMEYLDPFKTYPGAPKFQHPIDYIYTEFEKWKEKQKKNIE